MHVKNRKFVLLKLLNLEKKNFIVKLFHSVLYSESKNKIVYFSNSCPLNNNTS